MFTFVNKDDDDELTATGYVFMFNKKLPDGTLKFDIIRGFFSLKR